MDQMGGSRLFVSSRPWHNEELDHLDFMSREQIGYSLLNGVSFIMSVFQLLSTKYKATGGRVTEGFR